MTNCPSANSRSRAKSAIFGHLLMISRWLISATIHFALPTRKHLQYPMYRAWRYLVRMKSRADRLKHARILAGFETAAAAARRYHWPEPTYSAHENATRGFPLDKAQAYASAFAVNLEWLITGKGGPKAGEKVAMVGYVGGGQKIISIDDHEKGAGLDFVEAPPGVRGSGLCAVKVRGSSMYPVYHDGDVIFYGDHQNPDEIIGKEVIVKTSEDEMFVKTLEVGSKKGLFTLVSYNAPPLRDVKIEWAARVRYIAKS